MLRVALIGLGSMGRNHYRVLKTLSGVEVVALCDVVKNDAYSEPFFDSVDTLLEEAEFDAALIVVPTFLHKEVALKCLAKGKDLFIEKPVASNCEEAEEILKKAQSMGAKVCVGYIERFNPVVEALKAELEDKEIYSIGITRVGPFPPRIADVGILTDLAVHDIDLIRFISGQEINQTAIFKSQKIHNHHEDNAILSFKLENEVVASVTTNWLTPFRKRTIEVATKEAYYEADLMEQTLVEYSAYQKNFSYVIRKCMVKKEEPLVRELKAFVRFVKTGDQGGLSSIDDSMITLRISAGEEA
ncbi:Gfo/Idh/MocA family oxidoreductase [Sulfurospirillum sp. T05]|uniref:Gfo/Idh/MocA family oxidoreductase n=1 Tax=Sulfurospirillum tamanense TaxID=2813362 RepID=A0ABS2WTY5_9BACT|nr:Gfo/Idh/MocA family oxidoreductase [Sulfurospirillum tamanensis]MBN2964838.1 Gfo/Idh/MocA family oxidoreductase [Sulfurospirillum tamanensis]